MSNKDVNSHAPLLERLRGRAFLPGVDYVTQANAWMREAADEIEHLGDQRQTVADRLLEIESDLIALAHCCNLDHQYEEAHKLQLMLTQILTLDIQCADVAAWPPKVNIEKDGTSVWEVIDEKDSTG